jgi:hypothetical protein
MATVTPVHPIGPTASLPEHLQDNGSYAPVETEEHENDHGDREPG